MRKIFLSFFLLVSVLLAQAFALTVLQLNLKQLTELSDQVFSGTCLSLRTTTDSAGRRVQYVTFQVNEMIKGPLAKKVTFKQLALAGTAVVQGQLQMDDLVREIPQYKVGEDAIVFLSAPGRLGLTAPVGLMQGKFVIEQDENGDKTVVNAMDNRGLFMGLKSSPAMKSMSLTSQEKLIVNSTNAGGPLPYAEFTSLVKKLSSP